jgi:hypothetical protein
MEQRRRKMQEVKEKFREIKSKKYWQYNAIERTGKQRKGKRKEIKNLRREGMREKKIVGEYKNQSGKEVNI